MGITVRTFRDPDGSNKTALIAEIPDMEAFQEVMKSEAAADAMKHDGVNPGDASHFQRGLAAPPPPSVAASRSSNSRPSVA